MINHTDHFSLKSLDEETLNARIERIRLQNAKIERKKQVSLN
jgi:hypothetical protein